jgi:hypothetical protein
VAFSITSADGVLSLSHVIVVVAAAAGLTVANATTIADAPATIAAVRFRDLRRIVSSFFGLNPATMRDLKIESFQCSFKIAHWFMALQLFEVTVR